MDVQTHLEMNLVKNTHLFLHLLHVSGWWIPGGSGADPRHGSSKVALGEETDRERERELEQHQKSSVLGCRQM